MDAETVIAMVSIITAGFTIAVGSLGPALGEARAAAEALRAIAQQPDEANTEGDMVGFIGQKIQKPVSNKFCCVMCQADKETDSPSTVFPLKFIKFTEHHAKL